MFLSSNDNYSLSDYIVSAASALDTFVYNGGALNLWIQCPGYDDADLSTVLPGSFSVSGTFSAQNDLDIIDLNHPYFAGLDDSSLDDRNFSAHGYYTLPDGATSLIAIEGNTDQVYSFEYTYGSGSVQLSAGPNFIGSTYGDGAWSTYAQNIIGAAVPEPATFAFVGIFGVGALAVRRIFMM